MTQIHLFFPFHDKICHFYNSKEFLDFSAELKNTVSALTSITSRNIKNNVLSLKLNTLEVEMLPSTLCFVVPFVVVA